MSPSSPQKPIEKVYILAGEPSGEEHVAKVVKAALKLQPGLQFRGMGGDAMAEQGVALVEHVRNTAIMGFAEVFSKIRFIRSLFRRIQSDILDFAPDRILLVDYPGFNLRMAKWAKKKGIPVDMYISPQVWAWKKHRVHRIARDIDRLNVILPFEPDSYQGLDLEVEYVGHPLAESTPEALSSPTEAADATNWRKSHQIPEDRPILALLPGSRPQEIQRMLPVLEETASAFPDCFPVIAGAPSRTAADYPTDLLVLFGETQALFRHASAGIVTSGTATLEAALAGMPQVVAYRTSGFTYRVAKAFSQVKYISLVNLILNKEAVPERIQDECTPDALSASLRHIMSHEGRAQMAASLVDLRRVLSKDGASARVARNLIRPIQ